MALVRATLLGATGRTRPVFSCQNKALVEYDHWHPVQSNDHLLTVLRYVERNPLDAGLVQRAQDWRWGSLWARTHGDDEVKQMLSPWPVDCPGERRGRTKGTFRFLPEA